MASRAVHEITNPEWMIGSKLSSTFHGRDIFSPVGAHVARGDDWTKVGPEMAVKDLVRLDLKAAQFDERGLNAMVIATDGPFGNLVTNIDADDFLKLGYQRGQEVPVTVGGQRDEDEVREDFQRCAGEPAAAVHRLARASWAGGESEQFCCNVWDQAACRTVYSAGGEVRAGTQTHRLLPEGVRPHESRSFVLIPQDGTHEVLSHSLFAAPGADSGRRAIAGRFAAKSAIRAGACWRAPKSLRRILTPA